MKFLIYKTHKKTFLKSGGDSAREHIIFHFVIFYFLENVFLDGWSFVFFTSAIFIVFNEADLSAVAVELQWLIHSLEYRIWYKIVVLLKAVT